MTKQEIRAITTHAAFRNVRVASGEFAGAVGTLLRENATHYAIALSRGNVYQGLRLLPRVDVQIEA